jgi:5-methylcytosine-specific restriction endonuclease McrA
METDKTINQFIDPQRVRGWFDTFVEHRCICQYCGFDGSRSPEDWVQLQGDHLIPRNKAGEHAEDSLNRITSCYYCNTVKRQFDPAKGQFTKIPDRETQKELIQIARDEIFRKREETWQYGGGFHSSFKFMMKKIKESDS